MQAGGWTIKLSALSSPHELPLHPLLPLVGHLASDSGAVGNRAAGLLRRHWRFLMSLSSISLGNLTIPIPNISNCQRDVCTFGELNADVSDSPEQFRSSSGTKLE